MPEALITVSELSKLIHLSEATIRTKASRAPHELPRRPPGSVLAFHPDAYREWALNPPKVKVKGGRPRQ